LLQLRLLLLLLLLLQLRHIFLPPPLAANDTQVNHSRLGLLNLLLQLRLLHTCMVPAVAAIAAVAAHALLLLLPLQRHTRQLTVQLHVPLKLVQGDGPRAQQQVAVVVRMQVAVVCCCCCNRRLHTLWCPARTSTDATAQQCTQPRCPGENLAFGARSQHGQQ
jgi:hypothetical protein